MGFHKRSKQVEHLSGATRLEKREEKEILSLSLSLSLSMVTST